MGVLHKLTSVSGLTEYERVFGYECFIIIDTQNSWYISKIYKNDSRV
jgi:hypothetical protein